MRIADPKETAPREQRVALVPESCKKLARAGYDVAVEAGAGEAAGVLDSAYQAAGATVHPDPPPCLARRTSSSRSGRRHSTTAAATRSDGFARAPSIWAR